MSLPAGTRLGVFEIIAAIGAGGMGEVYRARDTKLQRDVAIKVLPELFAADPDRLARFEREAQTLASLNHPNIAHVHGVEDLPPGRAGGRAGVALVMEFVDGEDLAERLRRGAIPVDEALPIARQIAEALEAAHERGIVHRDLKPANIKLTPDGTVKVLDFGLAKAMSADSAAATADADNSPTFTSPAMTRLGVILGSAGYMAPEQAKGKTVDKRADIWAFGVVLYEMLTGETLFAGDTMSEKLAAVIKDEPRLDRLPPGTPSAIRRLLSRCLERDPKLRLRDIGEARIAIVRPQPEDAPPASASPSPASRPLVWMLAAGSLVLAAAVGASVWRTKSVTDVPVRRFELPAAMAGNNFSIAHDGSRVAYVSDGHLYVRAFDAASLEAQDLGQVHVTTATLCWSPDGQTIGFTSEGRLRSIPAGGGPIFDIAKLPASGRVLAVAWQSDGTILFSAWRDSLYRVPATGGTPEVFVAFDPATEIDFHAISVVPGRRIVVTTHLRKSEAGYRVELIDQARKRTVLMADAPVSAVQYVPQGYLLLQRFGANEGIWAVPFAERPIDLTGAVLVHAGAAFFEAADDGTLLLLARSPGTKAALVWVDRKGAISPIPGAPFVLSVGSRPSLSPDGRRAVLSIVLESGPALVVRDLENGADTRLAGRDAPQQSIPANPGWFPSGDRFVHGTGAIEAARIMERLADGSGAARDLLAGTFARVSADGRHLVYLEENRGSGRLRYAPFRPDGGVGLSQPLFDAVDEPKVEWFDFSPDGSVLAYSAIQENGQSNIFLTEFPSGRGRWQVTSDGGVRPRFARDGRDLFYASGTRGRGGRPQGRLMAIPLTLSPAVKLGVPAAVFEEGASQLSGVNVLSFDVARDGRFLMTRAVAPDSADARRLVLVQNWIAAMRKP
jgi:hypothetical protein